MKALLNEEGYVESYALEGNMVGALECDAPTNLAMFEKNFTAFRIQEGTLILDTERLQANLEVETLDAYRKQREKVCFPIINRGQPWYDRLTSQQREELQIWYQAWLDVTQTQTIPVKPAWLK